MDLPFLKKQKDETPSRQYLLAIEISPSVVKSAVWSVINGQTQMLAVGHAVAWDDKTSESLLEAIDKSITDATDHLDPSGKIVPEQAMLGLSATWVHEDKIVPDKLKLLRDISSKLDLKLVGFVVTPEAVVKYIHHSEHVPPTAILLGFWAHHLEITLVRLGKIVGIQLVNRSQDVTDDVIEGLSRFANVDMLPSRMLLYDSGLDLEEIKQLLLAHPWSTASKKLPFLHFPKIEILSPDYTVKSIALSGGTEVARAIGMLPVEAQSSVQTEVVHSGHSTLEELGFVENVDISQVSTMATTVPEVSEAVLENYQQVPAATHTQERTTMDGKSKIGLPKLPKLSIKLPSINFSFPKATGIIIAVVFVLLLVGLGVAYWMLPKATVAILVEPRQLQQEFELIAATSSASESGNILSASSQEVSVSDNKSVPATGNKTIGDKATGNVVILNSTESPRKLASGTILTSPSGLKFVLDEEVTVSSASGSVFNPQPGKVTVKATASLIGTDHNLSAGTEFRVGSFAATQIAAKNEQAISGGTSRQVKAVAKADLEKLKSEVSNQLKTQAREQLMQQVSSDQTIIPESITLETITEDFNAKLDEATDNVSLTSKVRARGLVISKSDLEKIVSDQIKPLIPEGYSSISSQSQTFAVKKADKNAVTFTVKVTAQLLPEIDIDKVKREVVGKYPDKARDYISTLPAVSQIDISIVPSLPAFLATLPRVSKNISISVQPVQ